MRKFLAAVNSGLLLAALRVSTALAAGNDFESGMSDIGNAAEATGKAIGKWTLFALFLFYVGLLFGPVAAGLIYGKKQADRKGEDPAKAMAIFGILGFLGGAVLVILVGYFASYLLGDAVNPKTVVSTFLGR